MSDDLDRTISCLTDQHERLAALIDVMDEEQLTAPSGAVQWRLCDVLSHLGSGAEIMTRPLEAATSGTPAASADNQEIWARWDSATPQEQAAWFLEHDAHLVGSLRALSTEQREALRVDLGSSPEPVPLIVAAGMRLNEVALHAWDIEVGLDSAATVDEDSAEVLLGLFAGPLAFLLAHAGKADVLAEPAVVDLLGHGVSIGEQVAFVDEAPMAPTATFVGPTESAIRMLSGRLGADHTPDDVSVSGNLSLDDLRRVFPGY